MVMVMDGERVDVAARDTTEFVLWGTGCRGVYLCLCIYGLSGRLERLYLRSLGPNSIWYERPASH